MAATGEARIRISAAPGRVWSMVADVTRMGEWSPETVSCDWVDGATGPALGARFKGHNQRGRSRWTTTCEVTGCVPGKEFAFVVGDPKRPETRWLYLFETTAGSTEVTESFELVKPLSTFSRLLTRATIGVKDREADLNAGVRQTLERLRDVAEAR